jgi:uncharacterized protein (TIGR02453 family)
MAYLTKEYVNFFKELAANNNREWFTENKARYEEAVKKPFEALTGDIIARMHKLDPEITLEPKDAIFRIYRDIRFSSDKTPYKLHLSAVVSRGGRKDHTYPGLYYQVGVEGVAIAGGCWEPPKDMLYAIRKAIARQPQRFRKLLDNRKFKATFEGLGGEKNKIIPKEFRATGEVVPEIYNKSFHYWREYKTQKDVLRNDLPQFIVQHFKVARELNDFLAEAMHKSK